MTSLFCRCPRENLLFPENAPWLRVTAALSSANWARISVRHDPQTLQRQVRMDGFDLRQFVRNQLRVAAGCDYPRFVSRKVFRREPHQDLADQTAITENRAGHHRV